VTKNFSERQRSWQKARDQDMGAARQQEGSGRKKTWGREHRKGN